VPDGDTVTLEQQMEVMGRKLRAVNRMSRDSEEHKFETETVEGDGRGTAALRALRV